MREVKSKKNNLFKKFFIKICRFFGVELIDQSNFSIPTSNKTMNDTLSVPGKKSITLPMGKINITRPVKSLNIILRTCMSVNMLTQSKKRIFEKDKEEYTKRTLISLINSVHYAKDFFKDVKFKVHIIDHNSSKNQIDDIRIILEKSNLTKTRKFTLQWFLPVLRKYKNILFQVLLASFVIQLFTLANPLLIQVIIDKVINQRSLDTLQVLGIALLAVTILEGILSSLKTFLFAETTNRIDQRLGAEVIDHLLRLPLGYFDKRPVGELSSRVSELEKIRNFLTRSFLILDY